MRRFKLAVQKTLLSGCLVAGLVVLGLSVPSAGNAEAGMKLKKNETGFYRDFWDQNMYYEYTNFLHLERLWRWMFNRKSRASNVNVYDEVPDSSSFTNRHAKSRLSSRDLEQGYRETEGPDLSQNLIIVSGKFEGMHPGFFIEDGRGDHYLIKFDAMDNLELETAAEVIVSRFYHAIGYNVPQYTILNFAPDKLVPAADAKIIDDTGFKKKLTLDRLEEYLLFIPQDAQGRYRASVSKLLEGKNIGFFSFQSRRRQDPEDKIDHQYRREIRGLRVFASWLNNYDVRASNTLDMVVSENGEEIVKHYLIDFNASLGGGAEYPMFTFEHIIDYGEATKAFFSLGLWEKPWQKRWREAGEQNTKSPAVGNFDNRYFRPEKFKTQLPYYAFKDLTRADAFWAAKIIMTFTDEDIRAMVRAGELSDSKDADYIADVLSDALKSIK